MQTAIEELYEDLEKRGIDYIKKNQTYYEHVHQQQIYDAFVSGDDRGARNIPFNCEQYYAQTFKEPI